MRKAIRNGLAFSESEDLTWKTQEKLRSVGFQDQYRLGGEAARLRQSSPIVWENDVYLTCIDGPMKDVCRVQCVDLSNGSVRWTYNATTKNLIPNDDYHSRSAMSPVADARGVVAGFESGVVVALDRSGKLRWSIDLFEKYGSTETNHGISSSLCQNDDHVFVWVQRKDNPYVIALNKESGQEVWRVERPAGVSWGSPVMLPMEDGSTHMVMSCSGRDGGAGFLCGLDVATGKEIWKLEGLSGNSSQTPYIVAPGKSSWVPVPVAKVA